MPGLSRQELQEESEHLHSQVREMRRKCAIIHDVIDNLQKHFDASKRQPSFQRYSALKDMVKLVIHDELVNNWRHKKEWRH